MTGDTPLTIYRDVVRPEWVDYNGHLRDAFYLLIFSFATDALLDRIGLDDAARRTRGRSVYTLEAHVNYLHEIKEGTPVRVDARVLAHDAKRLHLYLELFAQGHDDAVSASEQMLLHVDTRDGAKSAPFDDDVAARVAELHALQRDRAAPAYAGRVIALPPRR
ncbi:thioesterase family protein [Burkholderia sp. BCCIQ04A]|uniref:Thioesterase family protein n=1 Tax=Burkholderia anthinoferrum TaxID=3090833 RepID=A0ABU5WLR8_9BURK|nr:MULTISPECIES: thioesterase family protein [Burkholderia]MEB2504364.1 thioesterase family protein [Burkholderia anthinoferrum]MEB2532616.1 thioesterase family protein [Burkholderia anthinoferrum]MEB2559915.1 thioesterase family protein [Burkholderia anthinoferrum]MEB2579894.1 thioesterase family protein [Burkholderia anthinoferrum]KVH03412.1 4-hydroxybenzoyl-CoA thioesterase [Burkholderia anthina]